MQPPVIKQVKLIFELGGLQVFTYQTSQEILDNVPYSQVYWQDVIARTVYGPFASVHEAMTHYTWTAQNQKAAADGKGQVIYVDFQNKRRLIYT